MYSKCTGLKQSQALRNKMIVFSHKNYSYYPPLNKMKMVRAGEALKTG